MPTAIDLSLEIIQATNDGDDLAPHHLKFVEHAVNGHLNDKGLFFLELLHRCVMAAEYVQPWVQGVEHLTRDHEGYVYWKGQHVEHWDASLAYGAHGKPEAFEIARRCQIIEDRGGVPSVTNVVWQWPKSDD